MEVFMLKIFLNKKIGHRAYLDGVQIAKFKSYEEVKLLISFWDIYNGVNHD